MPIPAQRVTQVRQLRLLPLTLAVQLCFRIRPTGMGLVGPLLAVKIHLDIPRLEADAITECLATVTRLRFSRFRRIDCTIDQFRFC